MENTTLARVAAHKKDCTAQCNRAQVLAPADLGASPDSTHTVCVTLSEVP